MMLPFSADELREYRLVPSIDGKRGPFFWVWCDICNDSIAQYFCTDRETSPVDVMQAIGTHMDSVNNHGADAFPVSRETDEVFVVTDFSSNVILAVWSTQQKADEYVAAFHPQTRKYLRVRPQQLSR